MTAKKVTVYVNGDPNYAGKKVTLPFYIKSMGPCLDKVGFDTRMKCACRDLCTPDHGHRIKFEQIQTGGIYVAKGAEKFKPLKYIEIKPVIARQAPRKEIEIAPVVHNRTLQKSGRARRRAEAEKSNNLHILVFKNGDDKNPPRKVHLSNRELVSMDKVCDYVTQKVPLESGAVFCLCSMEGKTIHDSSELKLGAQYIAVGHGKKFKQVAYTNEAQNLTPRSRAPTKANLRLRQNTIKKTTPNRTKKHPRHSKQSDNSDRKLSSTTDSNKESTVQSPLFAVAYSKQESVYPEDPPIEELAIEAQQEAVLGDKGVSPVDNIYEASGEMQERAREVVDDKEIVEDKPIDLVPAEEVTEEVIDATEDNLEDQKVDESSNEEQAISQEVQEEENQYVPEQLEDYRTSEQENQEKPD